MRGRAIRMKGKRRPESEAARRLKGKRDQESEAGEWVESWSQKAEGGDGSRGRERQK